MCGDTLTLLSGLGHIVVAGAAVIEKCLLENSPQILFYVYGFSHAPNKEETMKINTSILNCMYSVNVASRSCDVVKPKVTTVHLEDTLIRYLPLLTW